MEVRTKEVKDLTETEYKACWSANFGWDGYMRPIVARARDEGSHAIAIMLWDGPDDKKSSLKAWALLTLTTDEETKYQVYMTEYSKRTAKYVAQFWVKTRERRKGYGKMLMLEVKKHDKRPFVLAHDPKSTQLFASFEVTVTKGDRAKLKTYSKPKVA